MCMMPSLGNSLKTFWIAIARKETKRNETKKEKKTKWGGWMEGQRVECAGVCWCVLVYAALGSAYLYPRSNK